MDLEWGGGDINKYYEEFSLIAGNKKKDECRTAEASPKMGQRKKKNSNEFNERIFDLAPFRNIKE